MIRKYLLLLFLLILPLERVESSRICGNESVQDEVNVVELLKELPSAEAQGRKELTEAIYKRLMTEYLNRKQADLIQLGQEVAQVLPKVVHQPTEMEEILGTDKKVNRQVLYRRVIEIWRYETPLPLEIRINRPLGQTPEIVSVQVLK